MECPILTVGDSRFVMPLSPRHAPPCNQVRLLTNMHYINILQKTSFLGGGPPPPPKKEMWGGLLGVI